MARARMHGWPNSPGNPLEANRVLPNWGPVNMYGESRGADTPNPLLDFWHGCFVPVLRG